MDPRPPTVDLAAFGLRAGEAVRFRRANRGRWHPGRLERIERDGSIGVRDERGAARALPAELVEVAATGPKGGCTWEPLVERMTRGDQLELF
ncbi:MAG: hypothetical protein AVDCRST_MAG76-3258 [uncultured Acidimicrobiales bacterium]|uniref:Uncharacterized protein n=1 Tax=uncultured Acidimicrobiales bacterium TaxID=310071 RepID=A0A6J4J754_9ACTN|nr:MAG: hypothetical protein AVDCRST_MAG76-3258 [uncultured Acidimicrobiales bacterium]